MSPRISKKHAIPVSESTYREIAQRNGDVTLDAIIRTYLDGKIGKS